jgi:serine/threonine-protein phosphatase 2A regulatory subunit B''
VQAEPVVRMFDILRSGDCNYVVQSDLKSMLAGILLSHPGLEFLQDTPEFQDRYAETVILRIFYCLDKSGLGRITLRDLKRCALPCCSWLPACQPSLLSHA